LATLQVLRSVAEADGDGVIEAEGEVDSEGVGRAFGFPPEKPKPPMTKARITSPDPVPIRTCLR